MMRPASGGSRFSRAGREILLVALFCLALLLLARFVHPVGRGLQWVVEHHTALVRDALVVLVGLSLASILYTRRRSSELRREAIGLERAQRQIGEAETRYRGLVERLPLATYISYPGDTGEWLYVSPQIESLLGFSPEEWMDDSALWVSRLHPEDRERVLSEEARPEHFALSSRAHMLEPDEYRMIARDGRTVWVRDEAVLIEDEPGRPLFHGVLMNVTDRRQLEEALRAGEQRKDAIMRAALDCIITIDGAGRVLEFNPAAERTFGYTRAEAMGRELAELIVPPSLRDAHREGLRRVLGTGEQRIIGQRIEITGMRSDGSELPVELTVSAVDVDGDTLFTGYLRDISETKRLEDQLQQAQRLEVIGRLAGGVAHDFNNLLAVILNYAAFLQEGMEQSDPRREDVDEIARAAERAAGLVRQLLTFSRKGVVDPQLLDVDALIGGTDKLLRRTLGEDVTVDMRLGARQCRVLMDSSQLEQIVLNLTVNARDAMPQGGTLTIATHCEEVAEAGEADGPEPGAYLCLTVSDTGTGMTPEVQSHIYEPFFTTKGPGEGTGLGLATVYGVVTGVGGHISVSSEIGRGTTFTVYLPASPLERADVEGDDGVGEEAEGETVLVVEDEQAVRDVVERILVRGGYGVVTASSGDEAIHLVERSRPRVDLLLTDVIMPGMSGKEVADALRARLGPVPTLFMSGYTDQIIARQGILRDDEQLVEKPFTGEGLLRAVRAALAVRPIPSG